MDIDKERAASDWKAFNVWAKDNLGQGYSLDHEEGTFTDKVTRWCFNGFKAGRASVSQDTAPPGKAPTVEWITEKILSYTRPETPRDHEAAQRCARVISTAYAKAAPPAAVPAQAASGNKDWPEDFALENGNYQNDCSTCGERFIGYKRRYVCKECAHPNSDTWKVRALTAEENFHRIHQQLNAENGPTFMGEPAVKAAPAQAVDALAVADAARLRLAEEYERRIKSNTSEMGGNMGWARLEGAVAVVDALRAALAAQPATPADDERISRLRSLVAIQCSPGNFDLDEYMRGMANGLLVALSVFTDEEPKFKESPAAPATCKQSLQVALDGEPVAWRVTHYDGSMSYCRNKVSPCGGLEPDREVIALYAAPVANAGQEKALPPGAVK